VGEENGKQKMQGARGLYCGPGWAIEPGADQEAGPRRAEIRGGRRILQGGLFEG